MFKIIPFEKSNISEKMWDDFVINSNNGTMFQMQRFLAYHSSDKFDYHHLVIFDGNKIIDTLKRYHF